jgi:hypothetical protein
VKASTTDQIREAATFASITLGILSAFAGQRASSLSRQDGHLQDYTAKDLRRDVLLDLFLAVFGLLLLLAAAPLFVAAVDRITPLLEADTAFFSLFCLFYVGVALVVIWVLAMTRKRASLLKTKAGKNLLSALRAPA